MKGARRSTAHPFQLRDARFKDKGRGLHPDFAKRGWSGLREAAYQDDEV